jgi:exonuclease SbcD
MQRPFRFLHAADLHLDSPCRTSAELPEHLVDLVVEAPLQAATRLFDAALNQRVDFVVLAGDVIDPRLAAPREPLFLVEQFKRLADRNISVYWAGGTIDSFETWPTYVQWPTNVHLFPQSHMQRFRHEIAGTAVCEIIGRCHHGSELLRPYEFAPSAADPFSIAVAHAQWNANALGEIGVDYWALGGLHQRTTPLESNCVAHFAGTPQGRSFDESGAHGATIVSVDEQGRVQLNPVQCDVLRWAMPQFAVSPTATGNEIAQLLVDRTERLAAESGVAFMTSWQIACTGAIQFALRHGSLGTELIAKLQQLFGRRQPPVWTIAIDAELPEQLPSQWQSEETLRGDYSRAVQRCTEGSQRSGEHLLAAESAERQLFGTDVDLVKQLEFSAPDDIGAVMQSEVEQLALADSFRDLASTIESTEFRSKLLREAAWLGAELLSPPEAAP